MTQTVQEILSDLKSAVEAHSASEPPIELLIEFDRRLAEHAPFSFVHRGWLRTQGGGRTGQQLSTQWAWRQFLGGAEAGAVLAAARDQIAQNRYEVLEIRPIYGLRITKRLDLGLDAYLCPIEELPKTRNFMIAFLAPTYVGLPPLRHEGSALVFRTTIEPAIVPTQRASSPEAPAQDHGRITALVRHALPLLTDGAIEMPCTYTDKATDSLLGSAGAFTSSGQPIGNTISWLDNPEELPPLMRNIEAMKSAAISLSIDRLASSRLKERMEDRILDLGMAAEIALMHEPSGGGTGRARSRPRSRHAGHGFLGRTVRSDWRSPGS